MSAMEDKIRQRLDAVEREHGVRVLYACESGSRAWGFESADSDYDVRFVYAHPRDRYLRIDYRGWRDVIEYPIEGVLDVNGWDVRKALALYRKPNPTLFEWLASPIVYRETGRLAPSLRAMAADYWVPARARYHYLHMARGNFRDALRGDEVVRKKYLYVLRPLLAVLWIDEGRGVVPMRFRELVDTVVEAGPLRDEIAALVAEKQSGGELGRGPRNEPISAFIETELARREKPGRSTPTAATRPDRAPLDDLFRTVLRETEDAT